MRKSSRSYTPTPFENPSTALRRTVSSGFCVDLNSYKHRIDPDVDDNCPLCDANPHDVNHLFYWPSNPTALIPEDLWRKPVEAAIFVDPD